MPRFSLNIFLPAAGLGERLRPITYHIPKPLLPILGKPLIEITLERFSSISSGKIGINLHYKPEMLRDWAINSAFANRIELFPEDPILGTGGALKNAEQFLSDGHFIVHNADILSNIDFEKLIATHLSSGNIATLVTHNYPKYNNVVIDDKGYVIDVENPGTSMPNPERIAKKVAYTGIAVYSPEIFKFLPDGVSHATVAWLDAAKAGHKVQALDFTGCYWSDIGTPVTYASSIIDALRREGETVYISPETNGCGNIEMDGHVVIEKGNRFDKGISLRNCIVLPSSLINNPPSSPLNLRGEQRVDKSPLLPFTKGGITKNWIGGLLYENCILGHDLRIDLVESEILHGNNNGILIGTGGSARRYYRVKENNKTKVLMQCNETDTDYHRHIEYTKFFSRHSIPVPELIDFKPDKMQATFEDLGDISLYSWLKCKREPEQIEEMYRKVLDIAVIIHTKATEHVSECQMLQNRIFDYEHYRWETGYFIERFADGIKNIKIKNLSALQDEFHQIASKADSYPKTIIHRDFQSQNIMIHKGIPRVIDYQGARMGLPAYDIASILWDPYHRLKDDMRERLLEYYIKKMNNSCLKEMQKVTKMSFPQSVSGNPENEKNWIPPYQVRGRLRQARNDIRREYFQANNTYSPIPLIICRLQRHMQALGAYGFLSSIVGKKYFLKHMPEGVRLLKEDASLVKDEYPELYGLVMGL
jgi:NDP-sugar pyrophosphorylase family protein/aminoglycoside/choline kinase family phosphotransferase